ncbi:MAG: methyl-accepting chemotaxis protein [Thermoleophilia bacterium]
MAIEGRSSGSMINRPPAARIPGLHTYRKVSGGNRMKNIFRKSIEAKILGMVTLLLIVGFLIFGWFSITRIADDMTNQQEDSNRILASSVHNSLKSSMLAGKSDLTKQAIENMRSIESVKRIDVFSPSADVVFNGGSKLMGREADELQRVLSTGQSAVFYEGEGDNHVLTEIKALPNEAACQSCHGNTSQMRGAVLVSTSTARADQIIKSNENRTVVFMILTLVFIISALMLMIRYSIIRPLRGLLGSIRRIAAGDLTEKVPSNSNDELGTLANNFNDMTDNLRLLSTQIMETGEQTSAASAEISATVEQQASTSAEQSSAVAETTATIEELAGTARQIAETAESVSRVAEETFQHAQQGYDAVAATLNGMENINDKVNRVAEKTLLLGEKSQRISTILEIINDIADQTNLLALNAAVEAARAGDQGRGFAVVAGEVRRLAEESVEATGKIKGLIDEIQAETNSTILATEESAKEVQKGVELAKGAGNSLESILDVVAENTSAAKEISVATQQQKSASDQVVVAMTSISEASKQQASGARQTALATESLNQAAAELSAAISRFKVR